MLDFPVEKKRNETLQLLVLDPILTILDETDPGLDVDALDIVSDGIVGMKNEENSFLVITHYKKLLDKLRPSKVHILVDGRIAETGGPDLAEKIEKMKDLRVLVNMTSFEFNKIKESINSNLRYLDRREEIFSNFINNGFPNKRNESWRYFDLASKSKSYVKKTFQIHK